MQRRKLSAKLFYQEKTVKVSNLRGNEIPISDLWKDRKAVVSFARHFGWYGQLGFDHEISDEAEKEMEEEEELLLSLSRRKQMTEFKRIVSPLKYETRCVTAFPDQQDPDGKKFDKGTLKFGYLVNSHFPKTRTDISLRRSAVVASAITGASETVKVSDLRGNEIPISDLWKDRKAVVAFARHFGDEAEKEMEEEEELLLSLSRRKQMTEFKKIVSPLKYQTRCVTAFPDQQDPDGKKFDKGSYFSNFNHDLLTQCYGIKSMLLHVCFVTGFKFGSCLFRYWFYNDW
ncbi:hypothetical protein F2Q70_00031153 [Brassica cretica]|uniref:Uncharacterized protein n=1 Tax=Brassica cretica TaxID=69181 RepID=A0A8S9FJG5_BRACR|nr:hypothetical protein F2Q70_00031153 [Brassica cretica]